MCFFLICTCCNSCNRYSSKCIEFFILIISFLSFSFSLIGFFYINKENITLICYIIFIIIIIFSGLILICIIFIIIWRHKGTINTKRNFIAEAFSVAGLVITIFYLIFLVSLLSLMYSNYQDLNYPCSTIERNETNIKYQNATADTSPPLTFEENKEEFCIENPNYNIHKIPLKDYLFIFLFTGVIGILMFTLIYFWFNDFRRIKFLVDGALNDFDAQEVKREYKNNNENENENSNEKRVNDRINKKHEGNNKYLYKIYSQQEYGIRYDIYGRPIFKLNKINTKNEKANDNIHNSITQRFQKRKSILNNRVSIFKNKNVIKTGKTVNFDVVNSNSSDSTSINKFQFSKNKKPSINKVIGKTSINSNVI